VIKMAISQATKPECISGLDGDMAYFTGAA
jgi:hypothetical protein